MPLLTISWSSARDRMAEVDGECQETKRVVGEEETVSLCSSDYDSLEVYMDGSSDQLVNCHPKGAREGQIST